LITRYIEIEDFQIGSTKQMSWLCFAHWEPKKGICSLEFHPELKPHLLQLKEQFTQIGFADLLGLHSVYSVRIFELLAQYESIKIRTTAIDELRAWCGLQKNEYELYADFKRKIINRAKEEINTKTEYMVDYREIKESRKVVAIEWSFQRRTHFKKMQVEKSIAMNHELQIANSLIKTLAEYGFSKPTAQKIICDYDDKTLTNALKAVEIYRSKHDVKNPKALIRTALKEEWKHE
jgi:plasmid replication initiation protein